MILFFDFILFYFHTEATTKPPPKKTQKHKNTKTKKQKLDLWLLQQRYATSDITEPHIHTRMLESHSWSFVHPGRRSLMWRIAAERRGGDASFWVDIRPKTQPTRFGHNNVLFQSCLRPLSIARRVSLFSPRHSSSTWTPDIRFLSSYPWVPVCRRINPKHPCVLVHSPASFDLREFNPSSPVVHASFGR